MHLSILIPGGKGAGNGWGFDKKLKNWVKCPLVGHSKLIKCFKTDAPRDRSRQNILTFNIKSHKKRLGIDRKFYPQNPDYVLYSNSKRPEQAHKTEADVEIKDKKFPDFRFSRF
jgi:hypothetical protein